MLIAHLPHIFGDANQVLQVFFNLISNAVDALEEVGGGTLVIRTSHADGKLFIEFSDTGPGIKSPAAGVRSVLYHQAGRQRHRPGPEHLLRNRAGARRPH